MASGCFCYLVNHTQKGVDDFVTSLSLLKTNYLSRYPTPVIVFDEALSPAQKTRIAAVGVPLTYAPIQFEIPEWIDKTRLYGGRTGYCHMCRFFAGEIFHRPELAPFDYYCRLDTDSFILSPVRTNLFTQMEARDLKYGFIDDSITDQPEFVTGLWDAAVQHASRSTQPLHARPYTDIPNGRVYYTNFEVCRCDWFRSDPWAGFWSEIDKAGGIYYYRWGDHAIRYLGVRMYMPPAQIGRITSVHYKHTFEYNGRA